MGANRNLASKHFMGGKRMSSVHTQICGLRLLFGCYSVFKMLWISQKITLTSSHFNDKSQDLEDPNQRQLHESKNLILC